MTEARSAEAEALVWEDPPPSPYERGRWARVLEPLKSRPGHWARVPAPKGAQIDQVARNIRLGTYFGISFGDFDAVARRTGLYARYVGEPTKALGPWRGAPIPAYVEVVS